MEVTTIKCDLCGKKAETDAYNEPNGWYNLYRRGDKDKDFWAQRRDICDECAKNLGLLKICHEAAMTHGIYTTKATGD